jgi:hypothetical protein
MENDHVCLLARVQSFGSREEYELWLSVNVPMSFADSTYKTF